MKKLSFLLLSLSFFVFNVNYAQNDPIVQSGSTSKFRLGLNGAGSIDWIEPQNQKKFTGGQGWGYGWGPQLEIRLGEKTMLRTGFNLYSCEGSINYAPDGLDARDSVYFFLDPDENYVEWDDAVNEDNAVYTVLSPNNGLYLLKERKFRSNYINIPLTVKMKTNEMGYMTYFAEVGSIIGFNTRSLSTDKCVRVQMEDSTGNIIFPSPPFDVVEKNKIDFIKGTQPIKAGLVVGGGGEFTFSGTTALFFAAHFVYDFTNVVRSDKREPYLRRMYNNSYQSVGANSMFRSVRLTVGILF